MFFRLIILQYLTGHKVVIKFQKNKWYTNRFIKWPDILVQAPIWDTSTPNMTAPTWENVSISYQVTLAYYITANPMPDGLKSSLSHILVRCNSFSVVAQCDKHRPTLMPQNRTHWVTLGSHTDHQGTVPPVSVVHTKLLPQWPQKKSCSVCLSVPDGGKWAFHWHNVAYSYPDCPGNCRFLYHNKWSLKKNGVCVWERGSAVSPPRLPCVFLHTHTRIRYCKRDLGCHGPVAEQWSLHCRRNTSYSLLGLFQN